MGMNSKLFIWMETKKLQALKQEAKEKNTFLSELCRQKITKSSQLERIELKLDKLIKIMVKND